MEDEASVDWIGEALLRPPTPGDGADNAPVDGKVIGEEYLGEATSPTPSMAASPEDAAYVPLSESWPFAAPAPAPAPAPGRATYTPGRVTWGADVFTGAAAPGAATPETPKRHIFFAPRSPTDTDAFSPTPSMAAWTGAGTPSGDLYAAPAPAYTPGRTPGTPGVRWTPGTPGTPGVRFSDDVTGASFSASDARRSATPGTPTPSMAYSRAATPGTPTPSMACSPDYDAVQDDDEDSMATAAQAAQDDSPPWRTLDDEAFSPTPSMADRP